MKEAADVAFDRRARDGCFSRRAQGNRSGSERNIRSDAEESVAPTAASSNRTTEGDCASGAKAVDDAL